MKKVVLSVIVSLAAVFALPLSAYADTNSVSGHVYQQGTTTGISGATVSGSCVGKNGHTYASSPVVTGNDGAYTIVMNGNCQAGGAFTVTAAKDGKNGTISGTLQATSNNGHNIGLADVSIALPEMGIVTGTAAVLAAGGAFFVIRRRNLAQE